MNHVHSLAVGLLFILPLRYHNVSSSMGFHLGSDGSALAITGLLVSAYS